MYSNDVFNEKEYNYGDWFVKVAKQSKSGTFVVAKKERPTDFTLNAR